MQNVVLCFGLVPILLVADWDTAFEVARTEKLLGVRVTEFPRPQGRDGFDEVPADAPGFAFSADKRPVSGPKPKAWYAQRDHVRAQAPDGSVYEAECVRAATRENRRHRYGGADFFPSDVLVRKLGSDARSPALLFPDVGSHETAPHHLAIDHRGQAHLAVADVDIYQDNRLRLYWMMGNPKTGKWTAAWLVDRRGFTSYSQPWTGSCGESVHLVWSWEDARKGHPAAGSGLFHVERSARGFSRKTKIASGEASRWAAAVAPKSGRLLVVFSNDEGTWVVSRPDRGKWSRPVLLHREAGKNRDLSAEGSKDGGFIVWTTDGEAVQEWVVRPR